MNLEIEKLLGAIGLAPSEAKLYLVSLAMGPTSIISLGKKTGVTRQRIYVLVSDLEGKGLIKKINIGARQYYQAVNPEVLLDRANFISTEIKKALPILKTQQATNSILPLVSVYENPIAMREWYRKYMNEAETGEELYIWSTGEIHNWYEMDKEFYHKYLDFSENKGIKSKVILPNTDQAKKYQDEIGRPSTETRFLTESWGSKAEKWIWRNEICYLSIGENATNMIAIESEKLAKLEKYNFNQQWESLS